MTITAFNPAIVTKDAESVAALFEALGFERRHTKTGINDSDISNIRMRYTGEDGKIFHVDVASAPVPQDITAIRMNVRDFEEAKKMGAIALFGEKYGDKVRVVRFGPSCEFCGGIHARSTGRIGFFKIISESSVAAGIRRLEAKTGRECEELLYAMEDHLRAVKSFFNNAKDLESVIRKYIEEHDQMKKEIESFQAQAIERMKDYLLNEVRTVNGVNVVSRVLEMSPEAAKDLVFKMRAAVEAPLLCVIGSKYQGKPMLSVMMSDDMVKDHGLNAGQMVREAAKLIQGGGGGQPHFAQAGGKNADGLSAAVDKVLELAALA